MKEISLLAGAALLALATAPAVAQSASSPGLSESNFKCWDAAKNEVRDRLAGTPNMPSTTGSASTTGHKRQQASRFAKQRLAKKAP